MTPDFRHNAPLKVAVVFGFWTVIGLSFASQLYLTQSKIGNAVSWQFAVERALADWYVFALLSLPALWLARKFPLERSAWRRRVAGHLCASAGFSLGWMVLRAAVEQWHSEATGAPVTFQAAFRHALVATFSFNLLVYWGIITVSHAFAYYQKYHERELRNVDLEKRLTQAKLQALQMQLNPHFLFNSLHSISALMHQDVEAADRMLARLSELLRFALENTSAQKVSLREELSFLEKYLEIEQTRFGARLTVRLEIAPESLDAQVPQLILQPLVENAIRHGIEPHARPGVVMVQADRQNGQLHLQVRDNGGGIHQPEIEEGVGLANTRARLQQLYGKDQEFQMANDPNGGLRVKMIIPWQPPPSPSDDLRS